MKCTHHRNAIRFLDGLKGQLNAAIAKGWKEGQLAPSLAIFSAAEAYKEIGILSSAEYEYWKALALSR